MPDVSPIQLIIVLIIALVVLGPKRLPEVGRSLGKGIREFKDSVSGNDKDEEPPHAGRLDRAARARCQLHRHHDRAGPGPPHRRVAVARARRVKPDEQLTLVEHLDELRTRIIVVLAVLTVAVGVCFYKSGAILKFLAEPLPHKAGEPRGSWPTSPLDGDPDVDLDRDLRRAAADDAGRHLPAVRLRHPGVRGGTPQARQAADDDDPWAVRARRGLRLVPGGAAGDRLPVRLQRRTHSTTSCEPRTTSSSCC